MTLADCVEAAFHAEGVTMTAKEAVALALFAGDLQNLLAVGAEWREKWFAVRKMPNATEAALAAAVRIAANRRMETIA